MLSFKDMSKTIQLRMAKNKSFGKQSANKRELKVKSKENKRECFM